MQSQPPYTNQPQGGNQYNNSRNSQGQQYQQMPRRTADQQVSTNLPKQKPPKRNKPPSGGKSQMFRSLILVLATVLGCVFIAIFALQSASDFFGLNQTNKEYEVVIPENANLSDITDILYEKGIIDKKITFNFIAGTKTKDTELKPGTYVFNSNMSYDQLISMMKTGDVTSQTVTLRFLEGTTADEIAAELEKNHVCNAEDFLEYLQNEEFINYEFYNQLPKDKELRYLKLEGYLFPDTYEFYVNERIPSVVDKFFSNFERSINKDMEARMKTIKMDLDEVMTLASIIQREAGDPTEMRRVSSVFHNRLDNAANFPKLQSDVTLFYVEDHIKNQNRSYTISSTQEVYDAYNTYAGDGLPAGPICNPGLEAIMAALYPASTNFYYFVTDVEGEYYYAASLNEHNTNVELAASQDESGKGVVHGILTREESDAQK